MRESALTLKMRAYAEDQLEKALEGWHASKAPNNYWFNQVLLAAELKRLWSP